jgi:hypothetical protein
VSRGRSVGQSKSCRIVVSAGRVGRWRAGKHRDRASGHKGRQSGPEEYGICGWIFL